MERDQSQFDTVELENWVDEAVMSFIVDMKYKLRLNNHKGHWREYERQWLFSRLHEECGELAEAIADLDRGPNGKRLLSTIHECADIANYALMIADNCKREMRKIDSAKE